MQTTATQEAAAADAAHAFEQARRTGCEHAITLAKRREMSAGFHVHNKQAPAATLREARRLDEMGPYGRHEDHRQAAAHSRYHL